MKEQFELLSERFYNQYLVALKNGDNDRALEMLEGKKLCDSMICKNLHELSDCETKYGTI
jgi:hypothetical protein